VRAEIDFNFLFFFCKGDHVMPEMEFEVIVKAEKSLARRRAPLITTFGERPSKHFEKSGTPIFGLKTLNTESIQAISPEEPRFSRKIQVVRVMLVNDNVLTEIIAVSRGGKYDKSFVDRVNDVGGCTFFKIESSGKTFNVNYDAMIPEEKGGIVSTAWSDYRWNKSYINFRAGNSLSCTEPKEDIRARLPSDKPHP
jgi:hypothetical protein